MAGCQSLCGSNSRLPEEIWKSIDTSEVEARPLLEQRRVHHQQPLPPESGSSMSNLTGSTGLTTRATSADDAIYSYLFGSANVININDSQIPALIATAASAAVAQQVRDKPPQQGPTGPSGDQGLSKIDSVGMAVARLVS